MKTHSRGVAWSLAYTALVATPLIVLGSGLVSLPGSGWWFDFSMGLGFGALALMGGQFLLTARFRRATAPFGMDVLYVLHRWLAVLGLVLVVAHYLILRFGYPAALAPGSPLDAPLYMSAGRASLAAFGVVIASSLWRRPLGIGYDGWRIAHAVLAVVGMTLALVHVFGAGYYSGVFWTRSMLELFLGSLVTVVLYMRIAKPILATARPYKVADIREGRGRTWTLKLEPDGHPGLRFAPGPFAWLSLGRSPIEAREHPFSFSGDAEAEGVLEFTIKELGDFTSTIGATQVGTVAYVDGPHGVFTVDRHPDAPGFMFIAGGVGIAPIASMLTTLATRADRRPIALVYGTRSWEATPLREELAELEKVLDLRLVHVLEEPHEGWRGETGWPDPELIGAALTGLPEGVQCFMCGPEPLTDMAQAALRANDVPLRHIHLELFEMA